MLYKVEMRYSYGWDDACWEESEANETEWKPLRFRSRAEAQTAIEEFLADVKTAVAVGDMDMENDPNDYRIVEARD